MKKLTTTQFIANAKKIHGSKYDYSLVNYTGSLSKITISCPEHGLFEQTPNMHTSGKQGCSRCGRVSSAKANTKSLTTFIAEATIVHNNQYDYSDVEYITTKTKITINCSKHGAFEQTPNQHLLGQGCLLCGYESNSIGVDEFTRRSNLMHQYKYDYSDVSYNRVDSLVVIGCPTHGKFNQLPMVHLNGSDCPTCAKIKRLGGYSVNYFENNPEECTKPAVLYIATFELHGECFIKIGLTKSYGKKRLSGNVATYNVTIVHEQSGELLKLFHVEQQVLSKFNQYQHIPQRRFKGWTECFRSEILVDIKQSCVPN